MDDIVPKLYRKIKKQFDDLISSDKEIQTVLNEEKEHTFAELYPVSERVGGYASTSLIDNYTVEKLPDETLYWNIMERTMVPIMEEVHDIDNQLACSVQSMQDTEAGIGIAPQRTDFPEDRVKDVMNKISVTTDVDGKTDLKKAADIIERSLENISNSIIDEYIKKNAEFRYNAGLRAEVIRTSTGHCCEWCDRIAGKYKYPDVPKDIYRRHDNCRCRVEYVSDKRRDTIHSGTEGKRKYIQNENGSYSLSKEERIKHEKLMKSMEAERKRAAREKRIATWQKKKELTISKGQDITREYQRTRFPGEGKIIIQKGYDVEMHKNEIEMAQWLRDNLGGDVVLLREGDTFQSDFLWRGKKWELKNVSTEKAANSAIRKGLHQISDNPGGIILEYKKEIDTEELAKVIESRVKVSANDMKFDLMIIENKELRNVLKF